MTLFFDTETTSLIKYGQPSNHPDQPHLVEIAAILVDDKFNIVDTYHAVIRPMGWNIPSEVSRIHGITEAFATEHGVPEHEALAAFLGLCEKAKMRVAYNEPFDARIIRIALKRYQPHIADWWKDFPSACAMRLTQSLIKGKVPTLFEAHEAVLGRPLKQQHTAMGDAHACMEVFKALVKKQPRPTPKPSFHAQP
ncbi:MAG: 3'-5' exonuclease [Flavobacteriales bacterium]|nr:3'-5' exonuclease [Flavobacteriales bacterium]